MQSYQDLLEAGHTALDEKDYATAIDSYTQALALAADAESRAETLCWRGDAYYYWDIEHYDKALADYKQALVENPNHEDAGEGVELIECFQMGNKLYFEDKYEEAIPYFDKVIEMDKGNYHAYNRRGIVKDKLGQYKEAIADFNKAILLDTNNAGSYINRGGTKYHLGQCEEAIADFNKAILLNPNDETAYYNRGSVKYRLGQYKEAIEDYDKAILLNPNNEMVYYNYGSLKYGLGQYKEAIVDYDKAILLNPNNANAYFACGTAKSNLGQYKEAIVDLDKAILLNPNFADAHIARGLAKNNLGQYNGVIADLDKAILLNPNNANAYFARGAAKSNLGQYEEAIVDLDKAILLNPNFADAYNNCGLVKTHLGQYNEAIEDLDKAILLNPNFADAYNNRGVAKSDLGQYKEAIADLDEAILLNPNLADAYMNRGREKFNLLQFQAAITDLDKVILLSPNNASAYNNRGAAQRNLEQYEGAKGSCNYAIFLQWNFYSPYQNLSIIYRKQDPAGDTWRIYAKIASLLEQAKKIQHQDKTLHHFYQAEAAALLEGIREDWQQLAKGEYEQALAAAKEAQQQEWLVDIYNRYANFCAEVGEEVKAWSLYELALELNPKNYAAERGMETIAEKVYPEVITAQAQHNTVHELDVFLQEMQIRSKHPLLYISLEIQCIDENKRENKLIYEKSFEDKQTFYVIPAQEISLLGNRNDLLLTVRTEETIKRRDLKKQYFFNYAPKGLLASPKRIAMIVGNQSYAGSFSPLANPKNDAVAMEKELRDLGFEIFENQAFIDLNYMQFMDDLGRFEEHIEYKKYDVVLFYYAGHGYSRLDENYVLPIWKNRINFTESRKLKALGIETDFFFATVKKARQHGILIFDACRNEKLIIDDEKERTLHFGWENSMVENKRQDKSLIVCYATKHGKKAKDLHPRKRNGLYTGVLVDFLSKANLSFKEILGKVEIEVGEISYGEQIPAHYVEGAADFWLKEKV